MLLRVGVLPQLWGMLLRVLVLPQGCPKSYFLCPGIRAFLPLSGAHRVSSLSQGPLRKT